MNFGGKTPNYVIKSASDRKRRKQGSVVKYEGGGGIYSLPVNYYSSPPEGYITTDQAEKFVNERIACESTRLVG